MSVGVVLLQGAFEIINNGHIRALKRARSEGSYLIVALNTDALLSLYKGRQAVLPWKQKAEVLRGIRYVDLVVPAHHFHPLDLLKRHRVSTYCLTREWYGEHQQEIDYMHSIGGRVVILPRYRAVVYTSQIKERLLAEAERDRRANSLTG
jgi:glycerol-3-phosphate cytidylyltransferase